MSVDIPSYVQIRNDFLNTLYQRHIQRGKKIQETTKKFA